MLSSTLLILTSLLPLITARTDLSGCTSSTAVSPAGSSIIYFVPGTGELCDFLDCGGGRAPPKTTVPGCPQYAGTATYSPSFLAGYGSAAVSSTSMTSGAAATMTSAGESLITGAASTSSEASQITLTGTVSSSAPVSSASASASEGASSSLSSAQSGTTVTNSDPAPSSASSARSSSSSGSSTSTSTGTATGTAAQATATGNVGSVNGFSGVVGAMAAAIAFLL